MSSHELAVDAARDEVGAFVGFHEVAAFVAVGGDVHHEHALDGGLGEREVAVLDAVSPLPCRLLLPLLRVLGLDGSLAPCHHPGLSRYHAMVALRPSASRCASAPIPVPSAARGVNGVAAIVAGTVFDPVEVVRALAHALQDGVQHVDVVLFTVRPDQVRLAQTSLRQDRPHGRGVVLCVNPVAHVQPSP